MTAVQSPALALAKSVASTGTYAAVGDLDHLHLIADQQRQRHASRGVTITDPLLGRSAFTPAAPGDPRPRREP